MNLCFPDNTVLCNFASVDRIRLLATILNGRGRWTEAVAHETRKSAWIMYRPLQQVIDGAWLGEPLEIEDHEAQAVEDIRVAQMHSSRTQPTQNLGEAQTLYLIQNRSEFTAAVWISDDRGACDYARRKGITVWDTLRLMIEGCVMGDVPAADGYQLLHAMHRAGRTVRLPRSVAEMTG